jgi:hypothetical protein
LKHGPKRLSPWARTVRGSAAYAGPAVSEYGDKTGPYVARSFPVDQEAFNPVTVTVKLCAMIDADTWARALDGERMKLTAAARTQLGMHGLGTKGAAYEIVTRVGNELKIVERGRL